MANTLLYTEDGYPFYAPDDVQELKDYADQISLPAQLPGYVHEPYKQNMLEKTIAVMTGQNGEERFQLWPEKMVRSAVTLPVDVMSGVVPTNFGLRRNDFTDIPGTSQPNEELINRTQDLAGLASGSTLMPKPAATAREVLATMPKMNRMEAMQRQNLQGLQLAADAEAGTALAAVKNANPFYSVLENSLANISMKSGTKEQWTNAFKKYGTTADELAATGLNDLPSGQIARSDIEKHIAENKVELKEVNKGNSDNIKPDEIAVSKWKDDLQKALSERERLEPINQKAGRDFENQAISREEWAKVNKEYRKVKTAINFIENAMRNETITRMPNGLGDTKYSKWQLSGGENYREKLLTLPSKSKITPEEYAKHFYDAMSDVSSDYHIPWEELRTANRQAYIKSAKKQLDMGKGPGTFISSHWSEPDVLVHTRTNDRIIPPESGGRNMPLNSLHIEEIQSDWHQKGRKEGYKLSKEAKDKLEPEFNKIDDKIIASNDESVMGHPDIREAVKMAVDKKIISKAEGETYLKYADSERVGAVPDAPFKETSAWAGLAMKRLIRQAAEEGKDAISWTPGEAQAARYDLSKHIKEIEHYSIDTKEGKKYVLGVMQKNGEPLEGLQKTYTAQELPDVVGKEVADKIINNEGKHYRGHDGKILENLDLKVGGEWTKKFYDKMLVDIASSLIKKYGSKVEQKKLDNGQIVHVVKMTKELREAASRGFPLFSTSVLIPVNGNPFTDKEKRFKLIPVADNPFE